MCQAFLGNLTSNIFDEIHIGINSSKPPFFLNFYNFFIIFHKNRTLLLLKISQLGCILKIFMHNY
jgi:hypothetical protein